MDFLDDFTLSELLELENLYKDLGEEALDAEFCQKLATNFSLSAKRAGKPPITWDQVYCWFQEKQKEKGPIFNPSPLGLELAIDHSGANNSTEAPHKRKGGKVSDLSELSFEAKSWRDEAWYDVAAFINYRILHSGELEARVRFAGFANTHDEWVNVKTAVRERSIPLEPSECGEVKVGDLVLCFREREDHALYSDANVIGIERREHDATECTCRFMVRFQYDNAEEYVQLKGLCCRPS